MSHCTPVIAVTYIFGVLAHFPDDCEKLAHVIPLADLLLLRKRFREAY